MTKQFSNYSDLLTFTRASKGHALRPVSYGTELVTNGTFDNSGADWTVYQGTNITFANNRIETTESGNFVVGQSLTGLSANKIYKVQWEQQATTGSFYLRFGNSSINTLYKSGSGIMTVYISPDDLVGIYFVQSGVSVGDWIDNVSVKEVLFDQPDGTLTLFEHPDHVPRVEWDADRNRLGLLVEESRTNLITYSEDFSNAYWSKLGSSSIVSTDNLAPDGTLTASEISIGSGQSYIRRSEYSISVTDHSASFWVKAASSGSATAIRLTTNNTAAWGTGVSSKLTLTSEWQRIEVKGDLNSLAPSLNLLLGNADENNAVDTDCVGNVLVWGAQLEAGSFPTSYIKSNSGSTTTRSADYPIEIDWDNFGYNKRAGTFVAEFDYTDPNNDDSNYLISGGGSARFFYNNSSTSSWSIYDGAGGMSVTGIPSDGTPLKISVAMSDAGTTAHRNGTLNSTNASIKPQGSISYDALAIGGISAATTLNGHIKSIQYYPRRLTNAQLVQLTS